jgi:hypothetical protein
MQVAPLLISTLALAISAVTAWLTLLRRGAVKMTHPSIIFFGPDSGPKQDWKPKVYLRTLLFCTAKRGRVIESMHVTLRRNESRQNFNIWVIGDDRLSRGSGLFVGETGVVANHHFLTPLDGNSFSFHEGTYRIEKQSRLLFSHDLIVTIEQSNVLQDMQSGIYFDWGPDAGKYLSHVETKPSKQHDEVFEGLRLAMQMTKQERREADSSGDLDEPAK